MKRRIFLKGTTASIAGSLFSFKSIRADNKFDVAIIGAGLSGLNAALELEKYGLKTIVLEANNRVGGKLLSKKELNGNQEGVCENSTFYLKIFLNFMQIKYQKLNSRHLKNF